MASYSSDNRANLLAPSGADSPTASSDDPFVSRASSASAHHRFSNYDHEQFVAGPGSSPSQAKRALEAHLAETDRKLDEAGKLGTALVTQRKALTERLQEVEKLEAEGQLGPELREKLIEIEKEYNDLARESARVFLPKQRVPSNETNPGSPLVSEVKSGRRSVSPSKFESQATASPAKLSVPNRKVRNQPSNRVHDIEFAAEISTSLIAQVRSLQSMLAERDEEVRDLKTDKSSLEIETENLQQRLKTLDESEHRYREENWNLETRLQELSSLQREAADREKKLTQALSTSNAEKNATQKELDEVKLSHAKLTEAHTATVKHHDIELGTAKRNAVVAEGERTAMQRKIEDLTSQNQELAKAFSTQRGRALDRENTSGHSDDDFETAADNLTPEQSPPPSPIKGTPRHSMLETETMRSSLHHAQRTIQSQRSLIHREKTEKLELRRIIQDLRDDLEKTRAEPHAGTSNRRSKKAEAKEVKRQPRLLGSHRPSRHEIFFEDPEWEDQEEQPSSVSASPAKGDDDVQPTDTTDHFDTANEASESAFETANERATETEDFQTGNEGLSDSDDGAATETDAVSRGFGKMKRPPSLPAGPSRHASRGSFDSTASTSGDDDDFEAKTPTGTISSQRSRFRAGRGSLRRNSRHANEEPALRGSPTSLISSGRRTPQNGGQSLFAELQDYAVSDDDSVGNATPSRRSVRSVTPGSIRRRPFSPPPAVPALPRVIMVDSGVMTDPVEIRADVVAASPAPLEIDGDEMQRPESMVLVADNAANRESISSLTTRTKNSRPVSTVSYSDAGAQYEADMDPRLSQFPVPPSTLALPVLSLSSIQVVTENLAPQPEPETPPPALTLSTIAAESLEPVAEPETPPPTLSLSAVAGEQVEPIAVPPPTLSLSMVSAEQVEPIAEPEVPPPMLSLSMVTAEQVEPIAELETPPPTLSLSTVTTEQVEPVAELEIPPPTLSLSTVTTEQVEPVEEPETPAPKLTTTSIMIEVVEPRVEPEAPPPALTLSSILGEQIEPVEEPQPKPEPMSVAAVPEPVVPEQPELSMSGLVIEHVEPVIEPEIVVPLPVLGLSCIQAEHLEPIAEPEVIPEPVPLGYSGISIEQVEPVSEPAPGLPTLAYTGISTEQVEPVPEPAPVLPTLGYTGISTEQVEPVPEPAPVLPTLGYTGISTEQVEPMSESAPVLPTLGLSSITVQDVAPVMEPLPAPPKLVLSSIAAQGIEPLRPVEVDVLPPNFGFSTIESIETLPTSPRSPRRDAFILPRDMDQPETPKKKVSGSIFGLSNNTDSPPIIAEDETRQSPGETAQNDTPESQRPFKEISANAESRSLRKLALSTSDQGAQTSLTADAIDQLFNKAGSRPSYGHERFSSTSSIGSPGTPGTVRIHRSHDGVVSPTPDKGKPLEDSISEAGSIRRPGSVASGRNSMQDAPPLPANHRELIEAARTGSASGSQSNMGPPSWPASAIKHRSRTPSVQRPTSGHSGRGTPTPRVMQTNSNQGNLEVPHSPRTTVRSRQSSVSSFASELDNRFNIRQGGMIDPTGLGPHTDPRMIQAITQTMIGEYLWKYTRKTGRDEMSEKRHRRYFWVHPYTRTLYWSDRDPSIAGRTELRAKSVPIEAVRVVTDDNPMPPGLHRKSLIIVSPGRTVKFTCTTGQRHETWFNALSYLLLRTNADGQSDVEEVAENITREDVDEFNPQYGQRAANGTRARGTPSLSSYNSRTTPNRSPIPGDVSMEIPTLTPSRQRSRPSPGPKASGGSLSKLGGYWRNSGGKFSGSFSSRRARRPALHDSVYEASEVHDSAEDLREIIERQDRESDRLENVRACCDGKHDVGQLSHSRRGRGGHSHAHPGPSPTSAPMASVASRA